MLVVHADAGVRDRIRNELASRGFSVLTASPDEARYLAESEGVDVVLTETPLDLPEDVDGAALVCLGCSADSMDDAVPADADMEVLSDRIRLHVAYRRRWSAHRRLESRKTHSLTVAQQRLLPRPGQVPGVRFGVVYAPALEAGGDFYDVIPLAHGSFGVLVADTVGHDLGASYVTGALKSLTTLSVTRDAHPASVLGVLNEGLRPVLGEGRYVTALFARVDVVRGLLTLASAGHPSPLWVPLNGSPRFLEAQGDVLGVYPRIDTPELRVPAPPGSRLYAFSDGLLEAVAQSVGERPRVAGILEAVAEEVRSYPVELAVAEIVSRLVGEGSGQADDIVLLGVEV
ncbi:MAG: SpoIIE family protein phosphatase [Deltaproteobacteria bacterium]|nr:SpoIIE family protein phosphatase [Deltaproteobacteria bacterium]